MRGGGEAHTTAGAVVLKLAEILLEDVDAALELMVGVGRELNLDGLEADAQVLELVVVFVELAFQIRHAILQKYDALRRSFGALDEEVVDVLESRVSRGVYNVGTAGARSHAYLHLFLPRLEVLGNL